MQKYLRDYSWYNFEQKKAFELDIWLETLQQVKNIKNMMRLTKNTKAIYQQNNNRISNYLLFFIDKE